MADSRSLALVQVNNILDVVRCAAGETKSIGRIAAHICRIDPGDADCAAVYLTELGFSGHAHRLKHDVSHLLTSVNNAFRGPFVSIPTKDDEKQELRSLRSLHSEASRLLRFLNDLRNILKKDDAPKTGNCDPAGDQKGTVQRAKSTGSAISKTRGSIAKPDKARIQEDTLLRIIMDHHFDDSGNIVSEAPLSQKAMSDRLRQEFKDKKYNCGCSTLTVKRILNRLHEHEGEPASATGYKTYLRQCSELMLLKQFLNLKMGKIAEAFAATRAAMQPHETHVCSAKGCDDTAVQQLNGRFYCGDCFAEKSDQ